MVYSNTMGETEYGISGHLHIFKLFEALDNAFEVLFSGLDFYMQLRVFKWKHC